MEVDRRTLPSSHGSRTSEYASTSAAEVRRKVFSCVSSASATFSASFSARVKKVCRHGRALRVARKTPRNHHLPRRIGHAELGTHLRAAARREALSRAEIRPPAFSFQIDAAGSIRYCSFEAPKASGL